MINNTLKQERDLFKWYMEVVDNIPNSIDSMHDLESEYRQFHGLASFLWSICLYITNDSKNISKEVVLSTVKKHLEHLDKMIVQGEVLYKTLIGSSRQQLGDILDSFDWDIDGTENSIFITSTDKTVMLVIDLSSDQGYIIDAVRVNDELKDGLSQSDFETLVRDVMRTRG